ncbi:transposase [Moraxella sp. FZLJ2107]|uniref:transposase n=2 Tax=unclassified Moraxella TaxID=2685852 RepID=UPI0020C8B81A|nr:transposase [Moraxella sp. FZLJ2107]UTO05255.1 transposase [Moraxella sp. FZLJ2107]UTO05269.1 transposase [Moraxella sp. FZLJ2107]
MTKQRKQYSNEFKLEMVKLIEEQNQRVVDVARQYDIGKSTLENWLKRYRLELQGKPLATGHALTPEQRELERLRKENAQLRLERDILKKASALLAQDSLLSR